jgi:hypothetical protein
MNLPTRIALLRTKLSNVDNNKVALAAELYSARRDVYWKDTSYGSFKAFCVAEVALSQASVFVYLNVFRLSEANKFTAAQMSRIVDTIGWGRFRAGLTKIDSSEIITVAEFLGRYKNVNLNERVSYEKDESDLVDFPIRIPKTAAVILTNALVARGMRITNKTRANMSSAMVKVIRDLIEQDGE